MSRATRLQPQSWEAWATAFPDDEWIAALPEYGQELEQMDAEIRELRERYDATVGYMRGIERMAERMSAALVA